MYLNYSSTVYTCCVTASKRLLYVVASMIILEKLSFSKPLKTTAKTKPSHTKGGQWCPHWPKTLQHVLKRASPFWVTLAALVPSVIILHHFKSHWLSFFFPTVISYNLPMMSSMLSSSSSAFISVNCISLYGLHWNDYTAKQFVTMHLKKIIGHMTSACVCAHVHVYGSEVVLWSSVFCWTL